MATGTGASRRGWRGPFLGTAQSGRLRGSSGSLGCATSVRGRMRLPWWAGAGGSALQDTPGLTGPSAAPGGSLQPYPSPNAPGQGTEQVKGETCSKSTLFCSGRVSAPSSLLLSYLPLTCSLRPPSLPSLFRWFPRRRCFAPAPLTSLLRKQSHTRRLEGPDPHGELGGPQALLLLRCIASARHPASPVRSTRSQTGCWLCPATTLRPSPPTPGPPESEPNIPTSRAGPRGLCAPTAGRRDRNMWIKPPEKARGRNCKEAPASQEHPSPPKAAAAQGWSSRVPRIPPGSR